MAKKVIIGLIGEMGSGKSTVARYLVEKYSASRYSFSDMLKHILDYLKQPITRDNLIDLFLVLAPRFGQDVLAKPLRETVAADPNPVIVIESIRSETDVAELRKLPDFYLVGIEADMKSRFERIHERGQRVDDSQKTYEEFAKDHERKTEAGISAMVAAADFRISNNGDISDVYATIEAIMTKLTA